MPLAVGNRWHYRVRSLPDNAASQMELAITAHDARGYRMLEPDGTATWWRIEGGYLLLERPGEVIRFFRVPPRAGVSWWLEGADGRRHCVKVVGFEDIAVPAGRFRRALRIEMQSEDRAKQAVLHFAEGAGIVRRTYSDGQLVLEFALERFEPAQRAR